MIDLKQALSEFDGKHTDRLESLAEHLDPDAATIRKLYTLAGRDEPQFQVGATWILKRLLEQGAPFSRSQSRRCIDLLMGTSHWEARLHLLQMLAELDIAEAQCPGLRLALVRGLEDKNKLVRAWSYNGLAVLATQYPEFRAEVTRLLDAGQQDPAASVRARIRNVQKSADWTG